MLWRQAILGGLLCIFIVSPGWADDDVDLPLYFSGLRQQGLFRVAEEYALARMAEPDLTPSQQAILAVELSQVFASHAAEATSPAEAGELWERAGESIRPFLSQLDNPRWIALRSRQATLLCDRAMSEFWRSQLFPDSASQRDMAVVATRSAIDSLFAAIADIQGERTRDETRPTAAMAASKRPRPAMGRLTSVEIRRLNDEIEFLLIRMNLNLVQLLPTGPDRTAALLDADKRSSALAKHSSSDYYWPARLSRAEVLRRQGDSEKAFDYAKSLLTPDLPRDLADAVMAEQGRARLESHQPADAIQVIMEYGRTSGGLSAELRTILVECLIASIQASPVQGDSVLLRDLEQQVTAQQQLITGPWRGFADAKIAWSREAQKYGESLAVIVREGRAAAQRRDWTSASAAYASAVAQAKTEGKAALAAEFTYTQASVEIEAGHYESAARLLQDFVTHHPEEDRIAEAHLLAAWSLGQWAQTQPGDEKRQEYLTQLQDHLVKFPLSPTIPEVHWALAVDAIRHQQWPAAVQSLEAIPPEHMRAVEVAAQLPYCFEQGFEMQTAPADRTAWENRARRAAQQQIALWPSPPAGWTLAQCGNALRWARVLLRCRDRKYSEAEQLLQQIQHSREIEIREAVREGAQPQPQWDQLVPAVTQLRIISLAGMGRMGDAETLFSTATSATEDDLLAILSGLSEMAGSLDETARHDLGRIQLVAARRLNEQRSTLSPEVAGRVDRCLAEAYVATGDLPEAIAIYEALRKAQPRDRALLEIIGELSLQRRQPVDLKRAKVIYRQLEGADPPGSVPWLKTRLTVARICFELGEHAESQKLLKVTQILYPELGSSELKREYAELEQQASGKR